MTSPSPDEQTTDEQEKFNINKMALKIVEAATGWGVVVTPTMGKAIRETFRENVSPILALLAEQQAEIEKLTKRVAELDASESQLMDERDRAQDALQEAHIALGGDGEWVGRSYDVPPPNSGDLHLDVPVLAAQVLAASAQSLTASLERVKELEKELTKLKDLEQAEHEVYKQVCKDRRALEQQVAEKNAYIKEQALSLTHARAEAKALAFEEAAKVTCWRCADGLEVVQIGSGEFRHIVPGRFGKGPTKQPCLASDIRNLKAEGGSK